MAVETGRACKEGELGGEINMKKLFKQEWKFYISAILLLSMILIGSGWYMRELFSFFWTVDDFVCEIPWFLSTICYVPIENVWITVAGYVVFKFYKYWTERNRSGREFLVTIPVKKRTRELFYILADGALVLVPNIIYAAAVWWYGILSLSKLDVEIPWMLSALLPMVVVEISYLLMLFAVSRFIESLIVNGVWKTIGALVAVILLFCSLYMSEDIFSVGDKTEDIYYFMYDFAYLDGRNYYEDNLEMQANWKEYDKYIEKITSKYNTEDEMTKVTDLYNGQMSSGLEVLYKGKPIEETFLDIRPEGDGEEEKDRYQMDALQSAYDWLSYDSEMRAFEDYGVIPKAESVWANLGVSIFLIILTIYLAGKKDYSRSMFFFGFAKYIFAVLVGCFVLVFGFALGENMGQTILQKIMIVFSAICLSGISVYYLTPEHNSKL